MFVAANVASASCAALVPSTVTFVAGDVVVPMSVKVALLVLAVNSFKAGRRLETSDFTGRLISRGEVRV
jgi:hypothetical protein